MRQTVVHISSFQGDHKTGLVFSMIEGLKSGEGIKLICDQDTSELEKMLAEAGVPQLRWQSRRESDQRWTLVIEKTLLDNKTSADFGGISKPGA